MAYFNHAYKKLFIATQGVVRPGVHVADLKETPYGPGYIGLFDKKTNLSVAGATIGASGAPFYLGAASIRTNDKIGKFHGGYQEANKSKIINPRFLRKAWKVGANPALPMILEVGGTAGNGYLGAVLTVALGAVSGTGYVTATNVPTTGGTGTGLTVDITAVAGDVTAITINNPGLGYKATDVITIVQGNGASDDETFTVSRVDTTNECTKEFLCGETYYLRVEVRGTSALRFASHNLYRTLDASGGCCADPSAPNPVDASVIYKQWVERIAEDQMLKDFIRPILVIDGQSYAYNAADATAEGLDPATDIIALAPTTSTNAGIILKTAYVDTTFGNCSFKPSDYYGKEPIKIFVSEVDLSGDPCTFGGVCVIERCAGVQANGLGEQKLRELLLSEAYLQNFTADDQRIREITEGTAIFDVISRTSSYDSLFILHSVPRYNNPSGVFDNDQYLLEVVGTNATITALETEIADVIDGGYSECTEIEDFTSVAACDFTIPGV